MSYGKPYTQLYIHLLWATYDRLPLITPEIEPHVYTAIHAKLCELRCEPIAMGGIEDHIHCLCMLHPTLSIATLVQQIKGASSHLITHEAGEPESFRWQGCYAAFTVHKKAVPAVCEYVQNQKQHHAESSLWPDWERTAEQNER